MGNTQQKSISIIIRTKNEEKWIGRCLSAIFLQKTNANIEVILVDNNSSDNTVEVARRYPIDKVINISRFIPGKALNDGIRASKGEYLVCISAHCIPEKNNWLETLLSNFKNNTNVAGVYGRQLPMSFTDPVDKRDLMIVFGLDKRIQKKDVFFHNANSMIPRSIWEKFPFDESVSNIEDRVWGKEIIQAGYEIIYEPEAAVYHYHGLHQGNTKSRVKGVVSILEKLDTENMNGIPDSMAPVNINIAAIIPVIGKISKNNHQYNLLKGVVSELKKSQFVNTIYSITEEKSLAKSIGVKWLDRTSIKDADSISLNKLLMRSLKIIESNQNYPDSILYVNYDYKNRYNGIFDELIVDAQIKGWQYILWHNIGNGLKSSSPGMAQCFDGNMLK